MSTPHLILVPGLMCDDTVWEHQARSLGTLTAVEIADHGSIDSILGMAENILDRAPERFALAGHSMGGRAALQVYRLAPERVAGIALLDTAATPRHPGTAGKREAAQRYALLQQARAEGVRAMAAEWARPMVHPDRLSDTRLMSAILDMVARKTADTFEAQVKALLSRPDALPVLPEIRCPALVLCGRQDSWSVLSHHEQMAAMIPGSRLVVIEDCGHMCTMERPEAVTAAMREWLENIQEH